MYQNVVNQDGYTIHNMHFINLIDLYNYLKSNPKINNKVFPEYKRVSISNKDFYGESLEKSIEYCIHGYTKGFDQFIKACRKLNLANIYNNIDSTENLVRSFYGGAPLAPLVAANVPDCMLKYEMDFEPKVINIFFDLAVPQQISNEQIFNRGIATLYIIKSLEAKNYIVNFKVFALAETVTKNNKEIINFTVNLKNNNDLFLNIAKCYFPMTGNEFFRRIVFRLFESCNVKDDEWGNLYGNPLEINQIKSFYNITDKDLLIAQPDTMEIWGEDLYDDTIALIESLNLTNHFDIRKIKQLKDRK